MVSKKLEEKEIGSWDKQDNSAGLTYECRIMLFKALHNMIEKSLLQKGFTRLSKWFLMAYEQPTSKTFEGSSSGGNHVSYSFSFFLHGLSRICTSVDVKLHKPIRYINKNDLIYLNKTIKYDKLSSSASHIISKLYLNVILSPYSLNGYLIGYLPNDSEQSKKVIDDWKKYYPVRSIYDDNGVELPRVLVVLIVTNKNYRLFYPISYVYTLINEPDDENEDGGGVDGIDIDDEDLDLIQQDGRKMKNNNKENIKTSKFIVDKKISLDKNQQLHQQNELKSNSKSKKLDSLDLTIDSVARNGPTTPNISPTGAPPAQVANKTSSPLQQQLKQKQQGQDLDNNVKRKLEMDKSKSKIKELKKQLTCLNTLNGNLFANKIFSRIGNGGQNESKKRKKRSFLIGGTSTAFKNEINLKHQTIELIQENYELAYDIINKSCSCYLKQNYLFQSNNNNNNVSSTSSSSINCNCSLKNTKQQQQQILKFNKNNAIKSKETTKLFHHRRNNFKIKTKSKKKRVTFNQFYNYDQEEGEERGEESEEAEGVNEDLMDNLKDEDDDVNIDQLLKTTMSTNSDDDDSSSSSSYDGITDAFTTSLNSNMLSDDDDNDDDGDDLSDYLSDICSELSFENTTSNNNNTSSSFLLTANKIDNLFYDYNDDDDLIDIDIKTLMLNQSLQQQQQHVAAASSSSSASSSPVSASLSPPSSVLSSVSMLNAADNENDNNNNNEEKKEESDGKTKNILFSKFLLLANSEKYKGYNTTTKYQTGPAAIKTRFGKSQSSVDSNYAVDSSSTSAYNANSLNQNEFDFDSLYNYNYTSSGGISHAMTQGVNSSVGGINSGIKRTRGGDDQESPRLPGFIFPIPNVNSPLSLFQNSLSPAVPNNSDQFNNFDSSRVNNQNQFIIDEHQQQQITPPQSVENPGSVNSNFDNFCSNNSNKRKASQPMSNLSYTINSTSSNTIKAPSYEDLANIFEDEVEELQPPQQQQQQQQLSVPKSVADSSTTTSALNNNNNLLNVMTPPSHENIDLINNLLLQQQQQQQQQNLNNITNSNEVFLNLNDNLFNLRKKIIYEIPNVNTFLTSKKYSKIYFNTTTTTTTKTITKKLYPKWSNKSQQQKLSSKKATNQEDKQKQIISYHQFKQQQLQQKQQQYQQQVQQKLAKLKSTPTLSSLFANNNQQSLLKSNDFVQSPLPYIKQQPLTPGGTSTGIVNSNNRFNDGSFSARTPLAGSPYPSNLINEQPLSVRSPFVDSPSSQTSGLNTSIRNASYFNSNEQQQTPLYRQQSQQQQQQNQHQIQQQQQQQQSMSKQQTVSIAGAAAGHQSSGNTNKSTTSGNEFNCLSYNIYLSDTILNTYRDINFDSCTLCVCNNNLKGIDYSVYITHDGLMNGKNGLNTSEREQQDNNNQQSFQHACTCGFSSIVNRRLAYNSGLFYEDFVEIIGNKYECKYLFKKPLPMLTYVETSNSVEYQMQTQGTQLSNKIMEIIEMKYSCPFLTFYEHIEIYSSIKINDVLSDLVTNSNKKFFKKLLKQQHAFDFNQDENILCLNVLQNLLDDEIGIYNSEHTSGGGGGGCSANNRASSAYNEDGDDNDDGDGDDDDDENNNNNENNNNDGDDVEMMMAAASVLAGDDSLKQCGISIINHNWLVDRKELKSNIELTKCLKYMQPLLEEALQKKHTSRSWEKVHGPMTWQHFCRLPFRDNTTSSSLNSLNCHEPEPIPALLVSSSDRDYASWLCVSPYAIKFWDKLNIEPYSKQKNVAYLVLCPDVDSIIKNTKNYFKELNSIYELCHLGVHKSARRLANDFGIVRVSMNTTTTAAATTSSNDDSTENTDWFKNIHLKAVGVKLKNYFISCKNLSNSIKNLNKIDFTIYDEVLFQPQQQPSSTSSKVLKLESKSHSGGFQLNNNTDQHQQQNSSLNNDVGFNEISYAHSPSLENNSSGLLTNHDDFLLNNQVFQQQYQQTSTTTTSSNFNEQSQFDRNVVQQHHQHQQQHHPALQQQQSVVATTGTASLSSPTIVIYMIDPFDYTNNDSTDEFDSNECKRVATIGFFKAYLELINSLPEKYQNRIMFQIIPLQIIMDLCVYNDDDFKLNMLRSQAFNIFSLIKRNYTPPIPRAKTLTGFGPAALEEKFIRESQKLNFNFNNKSPFLYSPPFILAPLTVNSLFYKTLFESKNDKSSNSTGSGANSAQAVSGSNTTTSQATPSSGGNTTDSKNKRGLNDNTNSIGSNLLMQHFLQLNSLNQEQCSVLYAGYCLSEDQRYLLVSCCDENGEFLESNAINIQVNERHRRRQQHARRIGLRKLWEYILTIIAQTCKPWRIVIGRLGRLGHSELRSWGCLLSKKNLQRSCLQLKELCENCNLLGNTGLCSLVFLRLRFIK